jgi:hypothetical protein
VLFGILVPGEDRAADRGNRPGAEQLLLPHHHPQSRGRLYGGGGHPAIVSRGADGTCLLAPPRACAAPSASRGAVTGDAP